MKLIIGLGNPGEEYCHTRHNVGSMMIDFIMSQKSKVKSLKSTTSCAYNKYLQAEVAEIEIHNERIIIVKPQTFMNKSGDAVRLCVARYALDLTNDLFIIHDDLDIRLGEYKIQKGKGPKLHNGIVSVEKALGTSDFWRIRIGIDNRDKENRIQGETYVLQNFGQEEKKKLTKVFSAVMETWIMYTAFR